MFGFYVPCQRRQERLREGPFGAILDPLGEWLRQQGYSRESGSHWFQHLQHFGTWFASQGYSRKKLCQEHVERFLAERHRRPPTPKGRKDDNDGRRSVFPKAMSLLAIVRGEGEATSALRTPAPLIEYESHLREDCGLAEDTIYRNLTAARELHRYAFGSDKACWRPMKPCAMLGFVRQWMDRGKVRKNLRGYLLHYLRFLQLRGHDVEKLIAVLPHVRKPATSLPNRILSPEQASTWLAGFDRSRAEGRRDYAMALCLADLGMRAGDLAVLCLDDIDWKEGTIRIPNAKRQRPYWLPLPRRVGSAIAEYLRKDRPQSTQRQVFLRLRTPWLKPLTPVYVVHRLRNVAIAQGLKSPLIGTHTFRHTFATRLLRSGSSLKEVADMLGHEDIRSTTVYAQLDHRELSVAARPWPEVRP